MPKVKDETGNVVAELPYTPEGESQAEEIAAENPSWDVDYAPGGVYEAGGRVRNIPGYFGGGMVADYMGGYSPVKPKLTLKEGGKVKKK